MIKLTFDQQLEAAWNFHNIEKAVFEKEIEDLRAENERLRKNIKIMVDLYEDARAAKTALERE